MNPQINDIMALLAITAVNSLFKSFFPLIATFLDADKPKPYSTVTCKYPTILRAIEKTPYRLLPKIRVIYGRVKSGTIILKNWSAS